MPYALGNEHHDVVCHGLGKLRKDCNLAQGKFLSLARLLDLWGHSLADSGIGLKHVRGDEVAHVLQAVTDCRAQTKNIGDHPIVLSLAEHECNEAADALEHWQHLLGCDCGYLLPLFSSLSKLLGDPSCNLRLVCNLEKLRHQTFNLKIKWLSLLTFN